MSARLSKAAERGLLLLEAQGTYPHAEMKELMSLDAVSELSGRDLITTNYTTRDAQTSVNNKGLAYLNRYRILILRDMMNTDIPGDN